MKISDLSIERPVFATVLNLLHNRADTEEIVQDTFIRAFAALGTFRADSALRTWLFTILRRLLIDRRRAAARRRDDVDDGAGRHQTTHLLRRHCAPAHDEHVASLMDSRAHTSIVTNSSDNPRLSVGAELHSAVSEALSFLDQSLDAGFRPGMGGVVPDRFFWALPPGDAPVDGEPLPEGTEPGQPSLDDTPPPSSRNVH